MQDMKYPCKYPAWSRAALAACTLPLLALGLSQPALPAHPVEAAGAADAVHLAPGAWDLAAAEPVDPEDRDEQNPDAAALPSHTAPAKPVHPDPAIALAGAVAPCPSLPHLYLLAPKHGTPALA